MSEKKILKNIRSGQQESVEILIKKYYRDIYTYCFCRVEDRQTAQDLTQEVFLRFLQNLDSYEHTGKLKNYLYVTAGNLIKDHYRKRKEDVWEDEKIQQTADKLSAGTENISDRLTLQEIIRGLPELERELILLRYYQNLHLGEIARIVSMPVSTVRYRLKQAEISIKNKWEE
ncbi:sigma-70 family RNA polymerase sigma factor [Blautia coccoides]|uniref:ECF RNA polymerase sigma factor SigW n=1 Tax=Blautia producta TaxID=33035 RepID=A0ABZ0UF83_9FIRM|nr:MULTISPECIES: sigma-70 family RNA polymerase sigma factor [Blautia]MCB5876828.1 sigma-70 family RNA polymerase sigma factor [Blautia producta]MCB6782730.1 sigma-70 family RNA polymerase sigma factor [Blautia producta]MCQ4642961.1 sigma-70 family RNA polymerase sigma factor [Blautia coccoides]MCQ5124131.1 sigma-70 family RNA polymerase sigma factor [Blautia producta]MDT4373624.1 sigma-70 family RNA polymerase sigma factor [Blautia coccoides]